MKFIEKDIIQNIDTLFLSNDEKFILIDTKSNLFFENCNIEASSILFEDYLVLGFNSKFINKIFSLITNEIITFNTSNRLALVIDEELVVEKYPSLDNVTYDQRLVNLKNKEILFDFEDFSSLTITHKNLSFSILSKKNKYNRLFISCFSFTKIDYLWHFNLDSLNESHSSQLGIYNLEELSYITEPLMQINNLIGVLNNLLWVDVDVQMRGSFLLALDTETGAVVHLLQTTELQTAMPEHLYYYKKLRRTAKSHLDVENNMILGFGADFDHWQVDLTQPEPIIKFWYLEENFKNIPEAHAVQIDFSGITPTHIFFPNSHGHFPQVIAFNRKTMQVDWRQVFNDEKGYFSPKQVKANDTHLFVHMSDNSLHIFEKTED